MWTSHPPTNAPATYDGTVWTTSRPLSQNTFGNHPYVAADGAELGEDLDQGIAKVWISQLKSTDSKGQTF